jgi:hypothetical protein
VLAACFLLALLIDLEDGGSIVLWNISELLRDYMVSHSRYQYSSENEGAKGKFLFAIRGSLMITIWPPRKRRDCLTCNPFTAIMRISVSGYGTSHMAEPDVCRLLPLCHVLGCKITVFCYSYYRGTCYLRLQGRIIYYMVSHSRWQSFS